MSCSIHIATHLTLPIIIILVWWWCWWYYMNLAKVKEEKKSTYAVLTDYHQHLSWWSWHEYHEGEYNNMQSYYTGDSPTCSWRRCVPQNAYISIQTGTCASLSIFLWQFRIFRSCLERITSFFNSLSSIKWSTVSRHKTEEDLLYSHSFFYLLQNFNDYHIFAQKNKSSFLYMDAVVVSSEKEQKTSNGTTCKKSWKFINGQFIH